MAKIYIIGPAHPLRGGLATFDHRLAKELTAMGHDTVIVSFSLQYPNFLFPGKTQFSTDPAPEGINIRSLINSVNPLNWLKLGRQLQKEKPDLIVVRYWLPFMGPALGTILRLVKKNRHTRIVSLADNIIPHEKRPGDKLFTQYFMKPVDGFITMSEKVLADLRQFTDKPALLVQHPLYDNFGTLISKAEARTNLGLPASTPILLFFGFIRQYKGLDLLLRALAMLKTEMPHLKLLLAGEFYEDEQPYNDLVKELDIEEMLIRKTHFIADSEVRYYLCSADVLVQPYKNATQSGVTPLAYYFEKPMIVTNVGGLPALVPDGKCGLVAEPRPDDLARAIRQFYELGEAHFIPHLRSEKTKYSWAHLVDALLKLKDS